MAQFLRPDGNVTQTNFTNGFAAIDESTASDADFAYGANNTAAVLEVSTSNPSGTPASGTCTVRYRIAKTNAGTVDGGGNAVTVTGEVYEGAAQVATDSARTANGTWTEYSFTFAASAVTNWTDVRLRFTTSASGGSPANRRGGAVSWAELETPDASAGTTASPGTGALTLAGLAATVVINTIVATGVGALALTGFAPTVSATQNVTVTPAMGTLVLAGFAPTIAVSDHRTVSTGVGALVLNGFAPTVAAGTSAVTETGALVLTGFAPTVSVTQHQTAQPGLGALVLTGLAPTVTASDHITVTTGAGALSLAGFAPTLLVAVRVTPDVGALTLTGFAPSVTASDHQTVTPGTGQLTLAGFSPAVGTGWGITVTTGVGALTLTGYRPSVYGDPPVRRLTLGATAAFRLTAVARTPFAGRIRPTN